MEAYFSPELFDQNENSEMAIKMGESELLHTIKLSKNIFKLSLPGSTYTTNGGANINF